MEHFLSELTPLVNVYGLWIVFFGMMVEGTTMIIATGILCYLGMLSFGSAFLVAILGAIAGDQLWYFLGKRYAIKLLDYFPSFKPRVEKLENSVQNKGALLSFSGRFIYSGAILFPMTLGIYKYDHRTFSIFDTLGIMLWSFLGISLGYVLGTSAELIFGKLEKVWHFVLILAFIIFIAWVIKKYLLIKKH
ncbi:DedA family protein [Sulfurimonas sp.]|uniref:DedA family protein n=1 Tax=Sulfurimonas sp. TaxID=2022749 RepID=UPI0026257A95|nr:DedA family protein [Sulfurimonas sp.]